MTAFKKTAARRACRLLLAALLGLSLGAAVAGAAENQEARAQAQALHWLQLLGRGDYAAAYEQAAPVLQQAMSPSKWRQVMSELAAKTGPAQRRKLLHSRPVQDLPGAPQGHYYLLVYEPAFAKLPKLLEQVALLQGADGRWRVAGYYLK